jgi:type VI secretion system protein ImpM
MFSSHPVPPPTPNFAVGKFAGDAEYVRMDGGTVGASLEEWLSHATASGYAKRGDSWRMSLPMGSPIALLWRAEGAAKGELLCGVLAPSRDAVGRDYPLVIVTRFSDKLLGQAPHVAPLAFGNFLDVSYQAITEARAKPMPPPTFASLVSSLAAPTALDVTGAAGTYDAWAHETPAAQAWAAMFGEGDSLAAAAAAVAGLKAAIGPATAAGAFVARLPLGTLGPAGAVVWLDVLRRVFRRVATPPTAFWGPDEAYLLVSIGTMPHGVLTELWSPKGPVPGAPDEVYDVLREVQTNAVALSRPVPSSGGTGGTMQAWLDALGRA